YCPSGASCVADLTNAANDFSTANTGIGTAAFGASSSLKITSITRVGTTATATTSGSHGFAAGTVVTISNVTPTDYNGDKTIIAVPSSTTFTFATGDYPTTPSTGAYDIAKVTAGSVTLTGVTRTSSATATGTTADTETATITGTGLATFGTGPVTISGFLPSDFNRSNITLANNLGTSATYSVPIYPTATSKNVYSVVHAPVTKTITSVVNNSSTITVTASGHGFHTGKTVIISGTTAIKNVGD